MLWLQACETSLDACEALEEVLVALYNSGLILVLDDPKVLKDILDCSGCDPVIWSSRFPGTPEDQDGNISLYVGCDGTSSKSGDAGKDGGGTKGGPSGGGGGAGSPGNSDIACPDVYPSNCGRNPVSYASGTKIESMTDLSVSLVPKDFEFTRSYSSQQPDSSGNGLLGVGWTTSTMRFIMVSQSNCSGSPLPDTLTLYGPGRREKRVYTRSGTGSGAVWLTTGPATQYFTRHTVPSSGEPFLAGHTIVWRFHEPGGYTSDYADDCSAVGALAGLLLQTTDVYGRREVYSYIQVGPSTPKVARLISIHMGVSASASTLDTAGAAILFDWHLTGDSGVLGRLKQASVYRKPSPTASWLLTNRAEYLYHPATTPSTWSSEIGTSGDLIQVTLSTLLNKDGPDPVPQYHKTITQYRYHTATTYPTGTLAEDDRFDVYGTEHQLRVVIQPEQIEYFAQHWSQGPGGPIGPIEDRVAAAAAHLLTLGDSQSLGLTGADSSSLLADLASKIVGYDSAGKVRWEYLQTACGCSGAAQKVRQKFEYYGTFPPTTQGGKLGVHITEQVLGSTAYADHRKMYFDLVALGSGKIPYLRTEVVAEPSGSSPRQWVVYYLYDDSSSKNLLVKKFTPSALSSYVPFDPGNSTTTPAYTPLSNGGLVYGFAYSADNRTTEMRLHQGGGSSWSSTSISGFDLLWRATYGGTPTGNHDWLLQKIEQFRTSTTSGSVSSDLVEVSSHEFGFHSGVADGLGMAYHRVSVESELLSENGPNSATTYDSYTLYNPDGQVRWQRSADNVLTFFEYDAMTGALTKIVRNANPSSPGGSSGSALSGSAFGGLTITGWGLSGSSPLPGGELVTTYASDILGRTIQRTSPGGVSSYTIRTERESLERPGILYYAVVSLPHRLPAAGSSPASFDGPAMVSISNAGGGGIQSSEYEIEAGASYDPPSGIYLLKLSAGSPIELSRSTAQHNMAGQTISSKRWHDVANDAAYTDSITYDALGRADSTTSANGTITKYLDFDVLNRVHEVQVGTNSTNLKKVATYNYDSGSSTTDGVGNGNVTRIDAFDVDDTNSRTTVRTFDFRNRLVLAEPPDGPYELLCYDNLSRVIQRGVYSSVPSVPAPSADIPTTDRGLYSKTFYSQRGLRYMQQVAINPVDDGDGFLESHAWFDEVGRTVCEWMPNSASGKRVYDAHGRPTTVYASDRGFDAAPAATNTLPDAKGVGGDVILEQSEYTYNSHDRVQMVTSWQRRHDVAAPTSSGTSGALSSSNAVASYVGYFYDAADRQIRTVSFGTNDAAATGAPTGIFQNGTAPSGSTTPPWPPTSTVVPGWGPSDAYADQIVSGSTYNTRGLVETTIDPYPGDPTGSSDPKSRGTKVLYDDLSRRTAVIENYKNAVVKWNSSASPARWKVDSGLDHTHMDEDRVTSFVYDASGNVVQQVAHTPTSSDTDQVQVTRYIYGTSVPSSPTSTDSLVASKDLLLEVQYPNESTGEPGTTDSLKVKYAYNRLGELRAVTDQNSTIHEYMRDVLGRVTADNVTLPSGNPAGIDATVLAIGVEFDPFGRLDTVKSFDGTGSSPNVLNAVQFTYTDLWQVSEVRQDVDGDLNSSTNSVPTRTVTYHYENLPVASGNASRTTDIQYPDGTQVVTGYDTADWDSAISRNSYLRLVTSADEYKLARYYYVGHSMTAAVAYMSADVDLDRTMSADGKRNFSGHTSQSSGVYPGWDRFGRVRYHVWVDGALAANSTTGLPDRPPIVTESYTYDHASNRLTKFDARPGLPWPSQDNQYVYDGLDRLIEAKRGAWTGSALTAASGLAGSSQKWDLDMLGNWSKYVRDLNGNGAYTDARNTSTMTQGDLIDDRGHNQANEVGGSTTRHDSSTYPGATVPLTYDDAGNIKTQRLETTDTLWDQGTPHAPNLVTRTYKHDAWNRLVEVDSDNGNGAGSDDFWIARYCYNGLHWRVLKRSDIRDVQTNAPSTVQDRAMVYDASWRLIHQEMDDGADPTLDVADGGWAPERAEQLFWGNRYIDDALSRQQSAGTGAVTNANTATPTISWNTPQWYLTDAQFSVVAIIDPALAKGADVIERVRYDPYGRASHMQTGDFNGNGTTSIQDFYDFQTAYFSGLLIGDANRDGALGISDIFEQLAEYFAPGHDAPEDQVSSPLGNDSVVGYCGYIFNPETCDCTVRFRTYLPTLGRWGERDPAGYWDGSNIYQYAEDCPILLQDWWGLGNGSTISITVTQQDDSLVGPCLPDCKHSLDRMIKIKQLMTLRGCDNASQAYREAMDSVPGVAYVLTSTLMSLADLKMDSVCLRMNDQISKTMAATPGVLRARVLRQLDRRTGLSKFFRAARYVKGAAACMGFLGLGLDTIDVVNACRKGDLDEAAHSGKILAADAGILSLAMYGEAAAVGASLGLAIVSIPILYVAHHEREVAAKNLATAADPNKNGECADLARNFKMYAKRYADCLKSCK